MSIQPQLQRLIREFAAPRFKTAPITEDTHLIEQLGFDSVSLVELIVRIEVEFDIDFDDNEMNVNRFTRYAPLLELITSKLALVPGAPA